MSENGKSTKPTFHVRPYNSTIMALAKVGMDLVRPLPAAQGKCRFTAVAVD
jgi:hypothetical protein